MYSVLRGLLFPDGGTLVRALPPRRHARSFKNWYEPFRRARVLFPTYLLHRHKDLPPTLENLNGTFMAIP